MSTTDPARGFADPVHDSQGAFRAVLDALARPGSPCALSGIASAPARLGPEAAAILLTLADYETPVWFARSLADDEVLAFAAFHTGAPVAATPAGAAFVFIGGESELPELGDLAIGEDEYPDRSATLIIRTGGFGTGHVLSGPGIDGSIRFGAAGLGQRFWSLARTNAALYPLGVDFLFAGPGAVAGLPRSTRMDH